MGRGVNEAARGGRAGGRFRKALRQHPGAPAALRGALAAAAFKLGKLDVARMAFRRALALDPACVPALTGLAVLAMHGPPSTQARAPSGRRPSDPPLLRSSLRGRASSNHFPGRPSACLDWMTCRQGQPGKLESHRSASQRA